MNVGDAPPRFVGGVLNELGMFVLREESTGDFGVPAVLPDARRGIEDGVG